MAEREERPDRTLHFERRMSDAEALMWNLEKDPYLSASFASLTILDQPPDFERFRERMAMAVEAVPRLRQRVAPVLGRLAPPAWTDDPDFDLDYHVRRMGLPSPGTERQLYDLASLLSVDPFERSRPLWSFVIIEGLEGGRAALFQKMHHTVTDGEGGIRMSEQFIDISPDAEEPIIKRKMPAPTRDTPTNVVSAAVETAGHAARRQLGVARRGIGEAAGLVTSPARIPRVGIDAVETARSLLRQMAVTDSARSPLWTTRSLRRRFETLQVPFDDARRAAKALGGTLNDLFVTGAAGGAGAYHRAKGTEIDELRMAMPVSTRTDRSAGGNAFTPTRVLVPAGVVDPVERFNAVRERLTRTKGERAIGMVEGMAGLINTLPTQLLVRFARQQVETVDFATSNVRAAPFDLYIGGAKIVVNYPMGPTGGTAFNVTVMSYAGSLDMGVNIDTAAVDAPDLLRACLQESFEELVAAGS
ncbi:MAG: wax ester/triacylglycerol synthase family O-acyltransferase [Actinomycetota bacterium]